jgi:hypothetical protein
MRLYIRGAEKLQSIEQTLLKTIAAEIGVRVHEGGNVLTCEFDSYRQEVELMLLLNDFPVSWSPHDWRSN